MRRRNLTAALLLFAPLALAPIACGDDTDRAALEDEELDRELDMALQGDTAATLFEDTAFADTGDAPPGDQAQAPQPRADQPPQQAPRPRPRPSQEQPRQEQPRQEQPRQEQPRQQPRTATLSVPVGTTLAVRMNETLSTQDSQPGDVFTARLESPIIDANGTVIVPAGATVRGRVTAVAPSGRVGETAALKLAFESISFGGDSYPLQATVQSADVQQKSRTSVGESAGKVAAGAAAGAILGQVLGKDTESTLKGAAIGAAAGTAIAMGTSDVDAVLPQGAEVVIRVDQPITVTRTI